MSYDSEPPGKRCNHISITKNIKLEYWRCEDCGEVFKFEPITHYEPDEWGYERTDYDFTQIKNLSREFDKDLRSADYNLRNANRKTKIE